MIEVGAEPALRSADDEIRDLIYAGVLALDAKDFESWLDSCDVEFHYAIRAWSPEIRKDLTWLEHDRDGMQTLVQQLPRHNTDGSTFTRHATVYRVKADSTRDAADVVSAVSIYRTELDGGATQIFAVGHYHDRVVRTQAGWRLRDRELRLDTRSLGIGTHYIL
jgi:methanesulfonate monooxygenase small subunit